MAETFSEGDRVRFRPEAIDGLFHSDARKAREMIADGVVGQVTYVAGSHVNVRMKRTIWQMRPEHLEHVSAALSPTEADKP